MIKNSNNSDIEVSYHLTFYPEAEYLQQVTAKVALLKPSPSDLFLSCNDPYTTTGTPGFCKTRFDSDRFKGKEMSYIITICVQEKMTDSSLNNTSL